MGWDDGIRDTRALKAVLVVQLLGGLGYGLVFPAAALLGEAHGLSPAAITALLALHPGMRLVAGPVWGRLADRFGRRPVLLAGLALQAVGHLCFGFAGGPLGLAIGRALTGLGSADAVAAFAAVADLTTTERRAAGLGMLRAATGVGMLAGPVMGGLLGLGGLHWPARGAAVACLLGLLLVAWRFPETRPAVIIEEEVAISPVPWTALGVATAAAAAITLAEAIVPLAVEHVLVPTLTLPVGWTPPEAALLLTVGVILAWGVTTAVFDGALSARVVERVGDRRALLVGLLLWALAFSLTPPVYRIGVLPGGLAVACTAVPVSLAGVGLATWISRRAGPAAQGRATGATQGAIALGEFLGPAVAGALYVQHYGLPYYVAAGLLLLAAALASRLPRG